MHAVYLAHRDNSGDQLLQLLWLHISGGDALLAAQSGVEVVLPAELVTWVVLVRQRDLVLTKLQDILNRVSKKSVLDWDSTQWSTSSSQLERNLSLQCCTNSCSFPANRFSPTGSSRFNATTNKLDRKLLYNNKLKFFISQAFIVCSNCCATIVDQTLRRPTSRLQSSSLSSSWHWPHSPHSPAGWAGGCEGYRA